MNRLQDKIVLITGAARGMGAAHAKIMAGEGAKVILADVADDEGRALAAEIGDAAHYLHLDVTSEADWQAAVLWCDNAYGRLDVLINNAGIADMAALTDTDLKRWQRVLDINLTGSFIGMQKAVPLMAKNRSGSIINISSVEGLQGSPGLHAYVASKFAVRGITKSVAQEVAHLGIRVNSVHPGFIKTVMTKDLDPVMLKIPMQRGAEAEEVSKMIVFLASDEASYSTGCEFVIDGGLTCGIAHR